MALPDKTYELKKALEDGFRITKINHVFENQNLKTIVKLAKGVKTQDIVSENEKSFFNYVEHFQKTSDGYGNSIFIFIDDIGEYKKKQAMAPAFVPIRNAFYVQIGDRILANDVVLTLLQTPGPGVPLAKANFFVTTSTNVDFDKLDARDPVTIRKNGSHQVVFKGLINHIIHNDNTAFFECQVAPRNMTIEKLTAEFSQFNPWDSLYFITRRSGVPLNLPPDHKLNLTERNFVVIVPIKDLLISGNLTFANVEFYSIFDSKDDSIIRKSSMCQREPDWGANFMRARIVIKSTNHFDALKTGYSKIQTAINWLVFCNDLTFPVINENGKKIFASYNFFKHYSRITVSKMVYCREIDRESTVIFDTRELIGSTLVIYDPLEHFKPTKEIFEKMLAKEPQFTTQLEKNAILSLHWIARTVGEGNNIDRLLDLWTAIELIVLREEKNPLFNALEKTNILKKLKSLNYSQWKLEVIESKIATLNDTPLMENLRVTVEKYNLSLSKNEWKLIQELRTKRNEIIHGKKECLVTNEEIEKLRAQIEKILIAVADDIANPK